VRKREKEDRGELFHTSSSAEIWSSSDGDGERNCSGRIPTSAMAHNDWSGMAMMLSFAVGAVVFGGLAFVMVKEYIKYLNVDDDDIEEYGGDRTRIRHEAGI
jgi:hypothetical protein